MQKLLKLIAIALWSVIILQACQIQFADEQAQDQISIEQQLKLDAERMQAIDQEAAQITLDTLQAVQQVKQEIVLDAINISR